MPRRTNPWPAFVDLFAALLIAITLLLFYAYLKLQPESPVASSTAR